LHTQCKHTYLHFFHFTSCRMEYLAKTMDQVSQPETHPSDFQDEEEEDEEKEEDA